MILDKRNIKYEWPRGRLAHNPTGELIRVILKLSICKNIRKKVC